jgi:hypothetical protein
VLSTNCLLAGIASVSLLLVGCGCDVARTDLPQVVAPDRPDTLATEPVPTTPDQALAALNRGLSGADFAAIRLLDEDDGVESTYGVALWVQGRWGLASDGGLRGELVAAGFEDPADMSEAILRSFWRRQHGRSIDLSGQAREARAIRDGARPDSHGVLLAEPLAPTLLHQCSRPVPAPLTGTWSPDAATLHRLEQVLRLALQDAIDRNLPSGASRARASDYYRQYVGLVIGGREVVYVNGFHRETLSFGQTSRRLEHAGEWRTKAVVVCGGGIDFFGAEYDPIGGRIESITFNGAA